MRIISKIIKFISNKNTMKVVGMILILGVFIALPTYADTAETNDRSLESIQESLSNLLGILSWVWIFVATIAGKLMTNEFVYGSFMHMDVYLWKIWNIMKNFANFGLAFLIIFGIVKSLVAKGQGDDPKKIVVKALLAGVLIQASWFITGALLDISTIATSAIASFPASFIGDTKLENVMKVEATKINNKDIVLNVTDGRITDTNILTISDSTTASDPLDDYMPKYDSVSGPLIYIGMSALKAQRFMDATSIEQNKGGALVINFALKVLILGFYTLCLLLLVIANIIRIVFLRLFILAAPIIALISVFEKKLEEKGFTKYLNIKVFIDLIFKPIFYVGFLSLTLIVVVSMQQVISNPNNVSDMNGVSIGMTGGKAKMEVNNVASFEINDNIFSDIGDESKNIFGDLFMIMLTLFLLRYLLKMSITSGSGPIQDVMGNIAPVIEKFAATAPIIPTSGGKMGAGSFMDFRKQQLERLARDANIPLNLKSGEITLDKAGQDSLNAKWLCAGIWTSTHKTTLQSATNNEFLDKSAEILNGLNQPVSLSDQWGQLLEEKLQEGPIDLGDSKRLRKRTSTDKPETYRKEGNNLKNLQESIRNKGVQVRTKDKGTVFNGRESITDLFGGK